VADYYAAQATLEKVRSLFFEMRHFTGEGLETIGEQVRGVRENMNALLNSKALDLEALKLRECQCAWKRS
jgi:hypothetical protein